MALPPTVCMALPAGVHMALSPRVHMPWLLECICPGPWSAYALPAGVHMALPPGPASREVRSIMLDLHLGVPYSAMTW